MNYIHHFHPFLLIVFQLLKYHPQQIRVFLSELARSPSGCSCFNLHCQDAPDKEKIPLMIGDEMAVILLTIITIGKLPLMIIPPMRLGINLYTIYTNNHWLYSPQYH